MSDHHSIHTCLYPGPTDTQSTGVTEGEDIEFTIIQNQGRSTEVTDRAYTVTLTTSGGQGYRVQKWSCKFS